MQFTAAQIAGMLQGEIVGNPDITVASLSKIEEGKPGTLTFLSNPKYTEFIYTTEASIAIVSAEFKPEQALPAALTLIKVADPYACFAKLLDAYNQIRQPAAVISDKAHVATTASMGADVYLGEFAFIGERTSIGKGCKIYPHVYIGDGVKVGESTTLYPGVRIYADCVLGNHCTVHSGVIIGGDGFGFAPTQRTITPRCRKSET